MNNYSHIAPDLPEPTEAEIKQTKKLIKDRYDIVMPEAELQRLVVLIKELEWWQKTNAKPTSEQRFTDEQLSDLSELLEQSGSQNLSQLNIRNHAHSLLALVPLKEKQRIADEIRGTIVEYRPVPYDPLVANKMVELTKVLYGVTLTEEELEQLIPFLTKTLWHNEGLDSSLAQCLDDLISRKNNELHSGIRKALDVAICKLARN